MCGYCSCLYKRCDHPRVCKHRICAIIHSGGYLVGWGSVSVDVDADPSKQRWMLVGELPCDLALLGKLLLQLVVFELHIFTKGAIVVEFWSTFGWFIIVVHVAQDDVRG